MYQHGKRLKGAGFSLIFFENAHECSRIGISIHRMLRGAVRRNRIKRIFREAFRLNRDVFPHKSDIVVTVAPHFRLTSVESIHQAVTGLSVRYRTEKS